MTDAPEHPDPPASGTYERVFRITAPPLDTEFARVSQERVVDGLWDRPGLADRDRRLLTLAVLAGAPNDAALTSHLDAALASGDLTPTELEEAAVHLAHYAGWPVGSRLALAVQQAVGRGDAPSRPSTALGTVGVVGVGALGADVAAALVAAGADVVVHDADPAAAAAIAGSSVAAGLADLAARCGVVAVVVRDDAQVLDVVEQVAAAAAPGSVVLVHSTVSVPTIRQAASTARAAGVELVDVGLCRPAGMDSGLVALVGGEPAVVDRVLPVIGAVAGHVHRVGPLGSGMIVKAVRNAILYGAYASVAEGTDVCRAAGLDVDQVLEALRTSGAAGGAALAFIGYRDQWLAGDHADPGTRRGFVDLARKDIGVAVTAAADAGVDAPFARLVADAMPAAYLIADEDQSVTGSL